MALINGTESNDTLNGTADDDEINGLGGNDTINSSAGADRIDGGAGLGDRIFYRNSDAAITLNNGVLSGGHAQGDTLFNVEIFIGSDFADEYILGSADTILRLLGGSGDDVISNSSSTIELLDGGGDDDIITNESSGVVLEDINGSFGNDTITNFGIVIEDIRGSIGDDIIINEAGGMVQDDIFGGDGNDTITNILGGTVTDTIDGERGDDIITSNADNDIIVNSGTVRFSLEGGSGNDTITNTGIVNFEIVGGTGDDIITNSGTVQHDIIAGDGNDTVINSGTYNEAINGGAGIDTLQFTNTATGVDITLAEAEDVIQQNRGDSVADFEIVIGTNFDDTITGSTASETISGGSGNDVLRAELASPSFQVIGELEQTGDDSTVVNTNFTVIENGLVTLDILSTNMDPDGNGAVGGIDTQMYLFESDGAGGLGALVASNDDATRLTPDGSTSTRDSFLELNLDQGDYTVVVGHFSLTEAEARAGINSSNNLGLSSGEDAVFQLTLTGELSVQTTGASPEIIGDTLNGDIGGDTLFGGIGNDTLYGDTGIALSLDSVEGQVYRAFQAVFDRAPDLGGFNAFVTEVRAGRLTQEQVIAEFVTSTEFQNTYGTLDNRGFMEQLYLNVLDRPGDSAGLDAFTGELDGGRSRASVVVEFANAAEFVQLMTLPSASFATNVIVHPAEGQVFRIYQAVFDRVPDTDGFTAFVNSIQASVLSVEDITAEFVTSQEFQNTYGDLTNAAFVEALFANVLPGNNDAQGRANFTEALDNGTLTRAAMVAEFAESQELRNSTADAADAFVSSIFANSGDTLVGGMGDDVLFGGRGEDTFVFDTQFSGQDIFLDFTSGTDTIDLGTNTAFDSFAEILAVGSQQGLNAVFDFGNGNILTLENTVLTELTEADFGLDGLI